MVFPLYTVYVQMSSSCKDVNHSGLRHTLQISFYFNYLSLKTLSPNTVSSEVMGLRILMVCEFFGGTIHPITCVVR